ncbi:zinc-binding dehydrogenase [Actinoallomurus sp. NBC_01490]|uniref:zinc-binding dehydrogenase n=1 Tax=Actinoallomurus sp. NBC_01490 TaxID=2903557 RepID=UPI002E346594|nr:zinc-binding dehydrogenase [Actinoallomurus sp. NBC_01490]
MLCVQAARFGGPDVLVTVEAPDLAPGPGQVLVEVIVADTLHLDTVIRRGAFPFPIVTPPYVPGGGVAGTVVAAGPGVDRGLLGRRVVARTGAGERGAETGTVARRAQHDTHSGGYAERAVIPAGALVPVPAGVPLPDAAALVNDGMTAMLVFEAAGVRPGQWVLVTPAGGGLGNLLVQLAHAAGARVVGAARGSRKLTRARDAGADAVIDYERDDWHEQVRTLTEAAARTSFSTASAGGSAAPRWS